MFLQHPMMTYNSTFSTKQNWPALCTSQRLGVKWPETRRLLKHSGFVHYHIIIILNLHSFSKIVTCEHII